MDEFRTDSNSQPRGKTALDIEHRNILEVDEKRIDLRICALYGVNVEEAIEIHRNYHLQRIYILLKDRATKHGMTESTYLERLESLNLHYYASLVSRGELIENAAVDVLYKGLTPWKNDSTYLDDRYNSFYG